jgi:phosphoribosylanthranilate isomerase
LHGNESPETVAALDGLVIVKAIRVAPESLSRSLDLFRGSANLRGIVLETADTGRPGGTGVPNNWDLVRQSIKAGALSGLPPIIAAGGLNAENVGAVVRSIRPWAVDVSSGVEQVRGEKSEKLVREFVAAVQEADRAPDADADAAV